MLVEKDENIYSRTSIELQASSHETMQTKHQIQQFLTAAGVSPKKRLGQHFLIDLNLLRLLVDRANISSSDVVLEVGCGTGSLTKALACKAGKVIAVEIDTALAEIAGRQLAEEKNVEIINEDVLENKSTINHDVIDSLKSAVKKCKGRVLLVANLPYNVASPVILNLLSTPVVVDSMYVTIQREVAGRMLAAPGGREYGTLSIFLGAMGDVELLRVLRPAVFWPMPNVYSAMVCFNRREEKAGRIRNMNALRDIVNLFMGHRRKFLQSCTKFARGKLINVADWPEVFQQCSIDPTNRPERLSPQDYVALANAICDYL